MQKIERYWNPIKDLLPRIQMEIDITYKDSIGNTFVGTGYRIKDDKWHIHLFGNSYSKKFTVLAWMHRPEAYKP